MGQRLVINVVKDHKEVASIYYHWSAYSISALEEARSLIEAIKNFGPDKDFQLQLIKHIEKCGGCIDGGACSTEYIVVSSMYPTESFKSDGSRNDGLIAITQDGRDSLKSWAEGVLEVNLDTDMIYNEVFSVKTLEEYNYWRETNAKLEDIPEDTSINIEEIPFGDLDDVINRLENLEGYEFRQGSTIYELIA